MGDEFNMFSKPCTCGSMKPRWELINAHGLFVCHVCEDCEHERKRTYEELFFLRSRVVLWVQRYLSRATSDQTAILPIGSKTTFRGARGLGLIRRAGPLARNSGKAPSMYVEAARFGARLPNVSSITRKR